MRYAKPNFNREWDEAKRYPEFKEMGRNEWIDFASTNFDIKSFSKIKNVLGNVTLDFDSLHPEKKKRFQIAFENGVIEIPMAVKFSDDDYDLLGGNTRLAGLIKNKIDPKIWIIDMTKGDLQEAIKKELDEKCWKGYKKDGMKTLFGKKYPNCVKTESNEEVDEASSPAQQAAIAINMKKKGIKPKNEESEVDEQTMSDSSGAFVTALNNPIKRKPISKIYNSNLSEMNINEQGIQSSGEYDVPLFGSNPRGGRRDPLKIDGPDSVGKSNAVKNKKFPKFGGPGGIYIKIKEKCKKFPYCNQGDINNIEVLREAIEETSKKYGLPKQEVENIVLNGIKQIFI